ncbi:S66 peptidase family protein [Neptunicella marina]|uniref:LD-carboxypeptidase n=1 Tax=Neptunicella marina TaxID=2125989 RepID=A0A8J6ISX1_9ALTE|nr:LD-carboxypeptidase [Neptunicella marina]MBC3764848.1 LD-carboxypeptidase [Neptunicella marina]
MHKRHFLISTLLLITSCLSSISAVAAEHNNLKRLIPSALKAGDTIALVAPAGALDEQIELDIAVESFEAMGFKVKVGKHVLSRDGYFAGTDQQRAADINQAFADPVVKGIFAIRGGWGCNRILPYIDFDQVKAHPKIVFGYSDITSLLNAFYTKAGLVGFHGPVGVSYWGKDQAQQLNDMLIQKQKVVIKNPDDKDADALTQRKHRIQTLRGGSASGKLIGGNLTVLSSMAGSDYLADWSGHILFLEDVGESLYRIDRYLSTLQMAGKLQQLNGIAFGQCTKCKSEKGYGGFTLRQILEHYFLPLNIPVFMGGQFGHVKDNNILPVGINVKIDADKGQLILLESAVD